LVSFDRFDVVGFTVNLDRLCVFCRNSLKANILLKLRILLFGCVLSAMKKLFRIGPDKHGGSDGGHPLLFSWQPRGNFLATVGSNAVVHIWDRHGEKIQDGEIVCKGQGPVLAVEWDAAGEVVAVLQEGNGVVELWDINTRSSTPLDTNLKDPTFLKWSTSGPELAIGTAKGNLLLYNEDTRRKVPVLGKHPRRITCGAWGLGGTKLAMETQKTSAS
jgi:WD repeat-containing protein 19